MKWCPKCEAHKDHAEFSPNRQAKDGLFWWCRSCHSANMKKHRQKYPERATSWHKANRARRAYTQRLRYDANPAVFVSRRALRRAHTLRATPAWADLNAIAAIYAARKPGEHTDHIVPLKGHNVCGLHVEYNLRNIPAVENLSKGNKLAA